MPLDWHDVAMNSTYGASIAASQATAGEEASPPGHDSGDQPHHFTKHTDRKHHSERKPFPRSYHGSRHHRHRPQSRDPIAFLCSFSRRALIILTVTVLIVLMIIIGLAVGLSSHQTLNLPLPSAHGGPYTGNLTYYATGLGACGITSANGDAIVAVSQHLFDAVQIGTDPNTNPLCGKMVRVRRDGVDRSVDLKVADRCTGCEATDLDVTEDTFAELADINLGRVTVRWSWLDDVPS